MKTILLSLAHLDRAEETIEAAVYLAQENDAHIIGYYPIPGATLITVTTPGIDSYFDGSVKRLFEEKMPSIKRLFEERMHRAGVKYEWREDSRYSADLTKAILEHGREADIIVMSHEAQDSKFANEEAGFIADVILGAGRPVLVLPPLKDKNFNLKRVAIGWDASREACRAAFDSLPILVKANEVNLTWVNPEKKPNKAGKLPGSELATALARHDVNVTTKGLSNRDRTAKALINYVKEDDIDLLVLGAYGHSRLREQILGGVTEHIIKNLPCPVLFAN